MLNLELRDFDFQKPPQRHYARTNSWAVMHEWNSVLEKYIERQKDESLSTVKEEESHDDEPTLRVVNPARLLKAEKKGQRILERHQSTDL